MFRKGLPGPGLGTPHFAALVLRTHPAHTASGVGLESVLVLLSNFLSFPLYPIPDLFEPICGPLGW